MTLSRRRWLETMAGAGFALGLGGCEDDDLLAGPYQPCWAIGCPDPDSPFQPSGAQAMQARLCSINAEVACLFGLDPRAAPATADTCAASQIVNVSPTGAPFVSLTLSPATFTDVFVDAAGGARLLQELRPLGPPSGLSFWVLFSNPACVDVSACRMSPTAFWNGAGSYEFARVRGIAWYSAQDLAPVNVASQAGNQLRLFAPPLADFDEFGLLDPNGSTCMTIVFWQDWDGNRSTPPLGYLRWATRPVEVQVADVPLHMRPTESACQASRTEVF